MSEFFSVQILSVQWVGDGREMLAPRRARSAFERCAKVALHGMGRKQSNLAASQSPSTLLGSMGYGEHSSRKQAPYLGVEISSLGRETRPLL